MAEDKADQSAATDGLVREAMDSARWCFCTTCKHQAGFGFCDQCWCGNKSNVARAEAQQARAERERWGEELLASMQTPKSKAARKRAWYATPQEIGEAAVKFATKQRQEREGTDDKPAA